MKWQDIESAPTDGTVVLLAQFHPCGWPVGRPEKTYRAACVKTQGMRKPDWHRVITRNGKARFYRIAGMYISHWKPVALRLPAGGS
jgi:hypothetical protein